MRRKKIMGEKECAKDMKCDENGREEGNDKEGKGSKCEDQG
jgi:hypothetical protein